MMPQPKVRNFAGMLADDDGQGLVEYALIIAFVALLAIVALMYFGNQANNTLNTAASSI